MNKELIEQIKERAGVSEETAKSAAEAVVGFLKEKLPDSAGSAVESVARGESLSESVQNSIGGKLGGLGKMFGGE